MAKRGDLTLLILLLSFLWYYEVINNLFKLMPEEYTKEQIWKLLEKLPPELKEVFFSPDTSDHVYNICQRNKVLDRVSKIAEYTGHVLLGILSPEKFPETLEKEVKLKKETAEKIGQEIYRFVFYPVKEKLAELYEMKIVPTVTPA